MQYIILGGESGKQPMHKFKDGVGAKSWEEAKDFDNVAVIVPNGYVVMDFDTTDDAEIMLKIIEDLDLKCRVMKTTRGIHAWFKADEDEPKNFIKNRLACGLYSDRKVGNRNAYVKIKQDGTPREWLRKCSMDEVQVVPKWLSSVSAPSGKFAFKDMGEGSGRNQELFNYVVYLQAKGFSRDEIKETIEVINDYVLEESLSDSEIATITRDEAFKSEEEIAQQIANNAAVERKFRHNEFGDQLIAEFRIIELNNTLYVYEDNYYQADDRIIERKMIELYPEIKTSQRNEVLNYLKIQCHKNASEIKTNPYVINLKNTRLDVRTGNCLEFDPEAIEFDRIPVNYNPIAFSADVDKTLNKVFCNDKEIILLFDEMLGACLIKHSRYQTGFLFHGSGSNGKSTILDVVKAFLGVANISTMGLEAVTERFNTVELENKLANIGDDIENRTIKNSGMLKKIISGQTVQVERKGERPYSITPYATHIYSCNTIPHSFDKTDGFYRRWCMIPFEATISPTDEDYDPMLIDKLTSPEAMSYLLNRAINGAQRLIRQGSFTKPSRCDELINCYKTENSTALSWIEDEGITEDELLEKPKNELYSIFCDWCKVSGIRNDNVTGKRTFFREIAKKYSFDEKGKQKSNGKYYFVVRLD